MKGGMWTVFDCAYMEILDPFMPCIDLEVTQNMLILEQSNKMEVMEQGPDLMAEHTLCIM